MDSGRADLSSRVNERIAAWRVVVDYVQETETSILAFGQRDARPVVLKVSRNPRDEWRSGEVLRAFDGNGTVRVYDHVEGAILIERLRPGTSLADVVLSGNDDQAARILADVAAAMAPQAAPTGIPTVGEWGAGFDRYAAGGDSQIPADLLLEARRAYFTLCGSQSRERLLHGDLHHGNVLWDAERGWLAIDPKGVVGEPEYEVGAALRNPVERPALVTDAERLQKRVELFVSRLGLDRARVLAWAFSQAVLAAVWMIEEGCVLEPQDAFIALARATRPMVTVMFDS